MDFKTAIASLQEDYLIIIALPIFFISILLEWYLSRQEHPERFNSKDSWVSISMMLLSAFVEFIPKVAAFIGFWYLHELSPLKDIVQRQWWAWGLLFFADDFSYYWFHRLNHEIRILWAGHVVHHSSIKLNFATALRQGVGERLHKFFFWLWLPLVGFDPLMIFIMISISLFYQFWIHTEMIKKLPIWFEFIFNTPSHHRVHHASNTSYLDRNHGGVLIIWDRLFGTFSSERNNEPPTYGLTKNINTYHPGIVATHEYSSIWKDFKNAPGIKNKLAYIFKAPGWSHDGPDLRASTLRKNQSN